MGKPAAKSSLGSRPVAIVFSLLILAAVGLADYLADFYFGYELSLSTFYLVPISFALWNVGTAFAILVSVLSVVSSQAGDWVAGDISPNHFVPAWNSGFLIVSYLFVVLLLARLKSFNRSLEAGISERTAALAAEINERELLEKEMLTISEREQQRIGLELHDSLCQHLTATALAGQVLEEKLTEHSQPEKEDSRHVVELIEQGIAIARNLSRGLFPFDIKAGGLVTALQELAERSSGLSGIECVFETAHPPLIHDTNTATHLFRISQEAVNNAIKHSGARQISIRLAEINNGAMLTVKDDGCGMGVLPENRKGMGLHIMRHRAKLIGATFEVQSNSQGTMVLCSVANSHEAQINPTQ